jgi:hypothetical protein
MTKWEYLEVEVVNTLMGANGDITLFKPDGKHQRRNDKFGLVIAQLGLEGWELVSAGPRGDTGTGNSNKRIYVFKRPIKET